MEEKYQKELDALQSQIDQLKTQLSGITQYGSIDAAEKIDRLTKERDEARKEATNFRLRFATAGQMFRGNEYAAEIMGYKFSWE